MTDRSTARWSTSNPWSWWAGYRLRLEKLHGKSIPICHCCAMEATGKRRTGFWHSVLQCGDPL